jgi:uncharacterized protein YjbI with pentapeptide repeats
VFAGAVLTGVNLKDLGVSAAALEGCIADPKPLTPEEAAAITARLDAHQRWVEAAGADGVQLVLDGQDLRPLQNLFAGRSLAGLSARNALAIGLDFSSAHLQVAKFDGADLRDVNFFSADLRGASLRGARLAHARLEKADLRRLDLKNGTRLPPDLTAAEATAEQFFGIVADDPLEKLGLSAPR